MADFSMLAVTAVWGFSFTILKSVLGQNVSILFFVFSRFLVAAVFILPFCLKRFKSLDKGGYLGGIGVGILIFLGFTLQSFGIEHTTASKAAFITGMASMFVPFYLLLHKRRLPSAVNGFAILCAMFGMYLLTDPAGGGFNRGDFLVLLCALAFGAQIYALGIIMRGRNPFPLTFLQLATTATLAGVLLPFETIRFEFSLSIVGAILFLGILGTAGALLTQTWAQKKTSPIKIGLILTAEPLFAYLFASILLGDYFNPAQKIGGAIILAAVLAAEVLPLILKSNKSADG
jgi:drug/metabolite transporter (DMT)-like permease